MCNRIADYLPFSETSPFPVSAIPEGRTTETKVLTAFFRGESDRQFRIVDTQGFNEPGCPDNPKSTYNLEIINDVMKKLTEVDQINVFLICLPGISNRITNSLLYMLRFFRDIFGYRMIEGIPHKDHAVFWRNCVIAYTKVSMEDKNVSKRFMTQNQMTDEEVASHCIKNLAKSLKIDQSHLKHIFIDSFFDENNAEEKTAYITQTNKLYNIMQENASAMTKAMRVAYYKIEQGNCFFYNNTCYNCIYFA